MIDQPDVRGRRDAEIAYAVMTSAVPAFLLVGAVMMLGRWSGLAGSPAWPTVLPCWELLVIAGAVLRVVIILVRFDATRPASPCPAEMGLGRGRTEHAGVRDMSRKHGHWGFTEEAKAWATPARRRDEDAELRRLRHEHETDPEAPAAE